MEYVYEIIKIAFAPAAVIAGVTYLLKLYLESYSKRDLEKFRLQLNHELEKSLFEYQTKFSFYHQRQTMVIAELYSLLVDASSKIHSLTHIVQFSGEGSLKERKKNTADAYNKLVDYYSKNKIFIEKNICNKLDELIKLLRDALIEFDVAQGGDKYEPDDSGLWIKSFTTIQEKVPPIKQELEEYFREIVSGITTINKS
jgi:lipopolysaccharide export LptBFGC system permease protein LptF